MTLNVNFRQDVGLCGTCENAKITETDRDLTVDCGYSRPLQRIRRPIVNCNKYSPVNTQSLYDMERTAWILEVKGARVIGFKAPSKDPS